MSMNKLLGLGYLPTDSYEFGGQAFTTQELWCKISEKMNIIIEHFKYLDDNFKNEKENVQKKLEYLLGEGLTKAVAEELLKKVTDGTLGELINTTLLGDINKKVDDVNLSLNELDTEVVVHTQQTDLNFKEVNMAIDDIVRVNIKQFGAVGDGITNDYDAFVKAKSVAGINGIIFFPETANNTYYMSNGKDGTEGRISASDFPYIEVANPNITLKYYYDADLKNIKPINKFNVEWFGKKQTIDVEDLNKKLSIISSTEFNKTQQLSKLNFTTDVEFKNFSAVGFSPIVGLSNVTSNSLAFDKETSGTNLFVKKISSGEYLECLITKDKTSVSGGYTCGCVGTDVATYLIQFNALNFTISINKYVNGTPTNLKTLVVDEQYRLGDNCNILFGIKNIDNNKFEIIINGLCVYILSIVSETYQTVGIGHSWHLNNLVTFSNPILIRNYNNPKLKSIKYFAFGDSITFGAYAYRSYPDMVGDILFRKQGIRELRVDNRANSGDNSAQCLEIIKNSLPDINDESIITVQVGTNDCISGVSVDTYIANMTQIIDNLRTKTQKILISTFPIYGTSIANYNKIALYNSRLKQLCIEKNIKLIDNLSNCGNNIDLMPDYIHPNTDLLLVLAKGFAEGILEIINN